MVDDEEFCLNSVRVMLQMYGIDVVNMCDFYISGLESLNIVTEAYLNGIGYSIILTDFSMPGMDGIESAQKMRAFLDK